jgi:hypothetical protein
MKVSAPNVWSDSSAVIVSTSRERFRLRCRISPPGRPGWYPPKPGSAAGSIFPNHCDGLAIGNPQRNFPLIQIILYRKRLEFYFLSTIKYTSSAEPEDRASPICMPAPIGRELLP